MGVNTTNNISDAQYVHTTIYRKGEECRTFTAPLLCIPDVIALGVCYHWVLIYIPTFIKAEEPQVINVHTPWQSLLSAATDESQHPQLDDESPDE